MVESLGTYMHGVEQMGDAATDVMICLSIALVNLSVILSYILYIVYRVRRAWR